MLALEPAWQQHTRTPCAVLQGMPHLSGACGWCCYKHKPSGKMNPHPCTIALGKWAPACPRVSLPQKHTRTPCAVLQGLSHSSGACGWCCYKHKPSGKINPCPWTAALGKWATACPRASLAETHSHPVCSFARAASFVGSCWWCCDEHKQLGKIHPCLWTVALRKCATACPRASLAETHSNPLCSFARFASFIRCVRVVLRQAQAVGQDQPLSLDLSPRKVGHRLP